MKKNKVLILLATTILSAAAFAEDPMKLMQKEAAAFDHAMLTKDAAWFDTVSSAGYFEIEITGKKTDRKKAIDEMKEMFGIMKVTQISSKVTSAAEKGGAILATVHTVMSGKMSIPNQPTKGVMTSDMVYSQKWAMEGGTWKLQWLKSLKEKNMMDGKPMASGM